MENGQPYRNIPLHYLSLVIFLTIPIGTIYSQTYTRYEWVTGPWGQCQSTRCGYNGLQHREVWCRVRNGDPVHSVRCVHFPKPEGMRECFKKCDSKKHGEVILKEDVGEDSWARGSNDVIWTVSQWSRCQLAPNVESCGRNDGVRHRTVLCEKKVSKQPANEYLCERQEPRPASEEPCELLCRQDCVVGQFSKWSSCDNSCQVYNRTRTRNIVVPPSHGGKHCPPFSQMLTCDNCSEFYTYALEPWDLCRPFETGFAKNVKTHPLIGYQKRAINCLNTRGLLTSFRFCTEKLVDPILHQHQACIIPKDCIVSDWSQLLPLNSSCMGEEGIIPGYMVRTRRVLQLPLGDGQKCPSVLNEYVKIQGEDPYSLKLCKKTKWILTAWSRCESVPGYSHCGTGIRNRRAICVSLEDDGTERPVPDHACTKSKPIVSEACQVECNWDCSVSHWSSWSECRSRDCDDYIRRKRNEERGGKRHRTREILTLPGPGGKACPHLSETQACEPMACYSLNITYGDCVSNTRTGCGAGRKQIFTTCISRTGERVSDNLCWNYDRTQPPHEACHVPCSEDCVMSEWGVWSKCPDPCSGINGPNIRVRERHILAYNNPGGRPCPKDIKQNEPCPIIIQCAIYYWKSSGWGPCVLDNPNQKCGRGFQQREVTCFNQNGQPVIGRRCEDVVRPKDSQTCNIECPKDCTVSEWSHWSDCGVECLDVTARQILPKQRRIRYILQYPENKGSPCPNDLFEERQCLHLPLCDEFRWDVTEWSSCIIPPIVPLCGAGMRARNVSCRHANGTEHPIDTCLRNIGALPKQLEGCHVSCAKECQISDWSTWSVCVGGCNGYSHRTRKLLGDSKFRAECKNTDLYSLDQRRKCLCNVLRPVVIGSYSDCILNGRIDEKPIRFAQMSLKSLEERDTNKTAYDNGVDQAYCGTGKKYKVVACRNDQHDLEQASKCSQSGYEEDICFEACPIDCVMTEWSAWSHCGVTCGSGIQVRFRSIATYPANDGRKCPALDGSMKETQSRVCTVDCNHYVWVEDEWDSCIPQAGAGCGQGRQIRLVRCQSISENSNIIGFVDDIYCRGKDRPLERRSCYLSCPGECVLSEWLPWSSCQQPCNGQQTQKRVRKKMRESSKYYANEKCGQLIEERTCLKGDNCIEYSWELSDWSTCLVNSGYETCGVGHKERYSICRNSQRKIVPNYMCEKILGKINEPLVASCEIPCDIDCLLSDWSDWSICSQTCGLGTSTRYRTMIQSPIGNGRKCPTKFKQTRPCFQTGCYYWKVSEWSTCIQEKGVCGSSYRNRNVSCVGDDGLPVNSSRCPPDLEKLVLNTREPCKVPCPGECMLSEWSLWSQCFINCQDYNKGHRNGVQSRSRAILVNPTQDQASCDDNLWEDMSCVADRCYTFEWHVGPWIGLKRDVECQRSDGLIVEGGCEEKFRPQEILKCSPECHEKASCIDTDVCLCIGLSSPVYDNGVIVDCIMESNETEIVETTTVTLPAGPGNVWMYAVIAVGTIFVIAVAAALYNMCELFRTGPRPRKKTDGSVRSDNVSDVVDKETMLNHQNEINHIDEETNIDKIPDASCNSNVGFLSKCVPLCPSERLICSEKIVCSPRNTFNKLRRCTASLPCMHTETTSEVCLEETPESSMRVNSLQRACRLSEISERNLRDSVLYSKVPESDPSETLTNTEPLLSASSSTSATRNVSSACTHSFPSLPELQDIELDIFNGCMPATSSPLNDSNSQHGCYVQLRDNYQYSVPKTKRQNKSVNTSIELFNTDNDPVPQTSIRPNGDIPTGNKPNGSVRNREMSTLPTVNHAKMNGNSRKINGNHVNGQRHDKSLSPGTRTDSDSVIDIPVSHQHISTQTHKLETVV